MHASTPTEAAAKVAPAPQLDFAIVGSGVLEHAAVPTLRFALGIRGAGAAVRSLALNVQVRIDATRRRYDEREQEGLSDLFGWPEQWERSLRSLHWTNLSLNVGAFEDSTTVELQVACTYDLEVSAARYLHALREGEVPLEFLFSGTVFYDDRGNLRAGRIVGDAAAEHRLPIAVWRAAMDAHFPNSAWLRLDRGSFERLNAYKARNALPSWEQALDSLLRQAEDSGGAADATIDRRGE